MTVRGIWQHLRRQIEKWWGTDGLTLIPHSDGGVTIIYPDPRAARRRALLKRATKSQFLLGITTAVAAGAILKFLGLV